jgi:RNA polymerase sigma-70 factor (ECF subfamily)
MEAINPTKHIDYATSADNQLLELIASGKSEALEALYTRYVWVCYGRALRVVEDTYAAEEIVQDVFLKVWTSPRSYSPGRGKFSAWLYTLVHNRSIDRLRRNKRMVPTRSVQSDDFDVNEVRGVAPAKALADRTNTLFEEVWRKERGSAVHNALSRLSTPVGDAIRLAYLEGLSQREVAQRLGVPIGTIKSRTQHGIQQLRNLLDNPSGLWDVA